jgi:hypothetical protein
MGMDAWIYAVGEVSEDDLAAAEAYLAKAPVSTYPRKNGPYLSRGTHPYRLDFDTDTARYYGTHYTRGHWPSIHADILLLRRALPSCSIHYGSDAYEECAEATDEALAAIWEHFLGPDGNSYDEWRRDA